MVVECVKVAIAIHIYTLTATSISRSIRTFLEASRISDSSKHCTFNRDTVTLSWCSTQMDRQYVVVLCHLRTSVSGNKDYHIIYSYAVTALNAAVLFAFVLQTGRITLYLCW